MGEVVTHGFGMGNGGHEVFRLSDEIGNEVDKIIGNDVSTLVIGAPVSDTLTTILEVGTSSLNDSVVTTSSGSVGVVETSEVIFEVISEVVTIVEVETIGVSGATSSSEDPSRTTSFLFLYNFPVMCFVTSWARFFLNNGEVGAGISLITIPLLFTCVLRMV